MSELSATPHYRLLALDHDVALERAEERLRLDFVTLFDWDTVHDYLESSYDEVVARSTVDAYVPTLAERFCRRKLEDRARVEGKRRRTDPTVLFLCTHNAGRSQIALGFFDHYARGRAMAWSGGCEPSATINPTAVEAMAEIGIDISDGYPKPWTYEVMRAADVVVTMGCGDICPLVPGPRYLEWIIDDPAGLEIDEVRPIRDDIGRRVENLLTELGVPPR
ncbi:arsenate reductase ArsC [Nocardia arizonensis]|uniref:arsenate reductase ArsC n=1 Tax=Nocardia arizonensis TaxID=1141647 RepID=UPI0006D29FB9|nr:arsenate reductase ArsC [Nocardia arizonensis]